MEKWGCPVYFYTGSYYESEEYAKMVEALDTLKEALGIRIIDMYRDEAFNAITPELYKKYMSDPIHPNIIGYKEWWTQYFEEQLKGLL